MLPASARAHKQSPRSCGPIAAKIIRELKPWNRTYPRYKSEVRKCKRRVRRHAARHKRARQCGPHVSVQKAIRCAFPRSWPEATRVAYCESTFRTTATNGQYRGLFQMGEWERSTYGHATHAYGQAKAAARYFRASGRDWSPWECKP